MIKKMTLYISIGILSIFIFSAPLFAQVASQKISPQERERLIAEMNEMNPNFFKYQNRLTQLMQEISLIVKDYQAGTLTKKAAAEKLTPLLKEQIEIMTNKDFLVAQRLFMLLMKK